MFRKKYILPNVLLIVAWLVIMTACAAPAIQEERQPYGSPLMAEHSMMKKRLPLIERENDVLKKENNQLRKQVQESEIRINDLNRESAFLEEKYTNDIALAEGRIMRLQSTIQEKDWVSTEKIQTLVSLNHDLEDKIKSFSIKMEGQKKIFEQERKQILEESAEKERALSARLDEIKADLNARESEIASLKATADGKTVELKQAADQVEALKKAVKNAEAELEKVRAVNNDYTGQPETVSNAHGGQSQ